MATLSSATRSTLRKQLRDFLSRCESSSASSQVHLTLILYPSPDAFPPRVSGALHISVLDSSFNPPSNAHLALSTLVPPASTSEHPNAHLLLFSATNADKGTGRSGDVKPENRLDLMLLLAKDVEAALKGAGQEANVFVGLVDKPLMGDKSSLIHALLRQHGHTPAVHSEDAHASDGVSPARLHYIHGHTPAVHSEDAHASEGVSPARLHYIVGTDTLVRFFEPKYYGGQEGFERVCRQFFEVERTRFLCVKRPASRNSADAEQVKKEEEEVLSRANIRRRIECGDVVVVDVPEAEGISSTRVRKLLQGSQPAEQKRTELKQLVTPSIAEYLLSEQNIWME
ncbi:Rossmann-like alpha/beta/alpha sandwich fold [Ceraceosorus bombacis]|uniref:Rossmann-like alpha/beta/alpha sandwich fold n=1 Tax=Ceraceosorus bombacis TaxID=401625 RepID=A0A0P1BEI7_9BASI|nr:Rossmann-like alpha/beta/alpha sandwich fold [Ceraceosorus bombacis]